MIIVGVIPARYASSRLPGKPLKDVAGKPMIQHVFERACRATALDSVIVATDDERIVEAVEGFGGTAVLTSGDHPNGTSRAAEVVQNIEADIVVNIQGDEPLIVPGMIDEVASVLVEHGEVPSATLCCKIGSDKYDDPDVVKTVRDVHGFALYFSRSLIPFPRHPEHLQVYEHIGIYGYRRGFLHEYLALPETPLCATESLEQLKILEHGFRMYVVETAFDYAALSVDTQQDLDRVREILAGDATDG